MKILFRIPPGIRSEVPSQISSKVSPGILPGYLRKIIPELPLELLLRVMTEWWIFVSTRSGLFWISTEVLSRIQPGVYFRIPKQVPSEIHPKVLSSVPLWMPEIPSGISVVDLFVYSRSSFWDSSRSFFTGSSRSSFWNYSSAFWNVFRSFVFWDSQNNFLRECNPRTNDWKKSRWNSRKNSLRIIWGIARCARCWKFIWNNFIYLGIIS